MLNDAVDRIINKEDLVNFVKELLRDFKEHSQDWENDKLELYLEALAAWLEDMDGYFQNQGMPVPDKANWSLFAKALLAAKYYE